MLFLRSSVVLAMLGAAKGNQFTLKNHQNVERNNAVGGGNVASTMKNLVENDKEMKKESLVAEDQFFFRYLVESSMSFTEAPSETPSETPSASPSAPPSASPSAAPSPSPSSLPSSSPSSPPSSPPSAAPSAAPSAPPSAAPSSPPSAAPSAAPSAPPSAAPSAAPSAPPSASPSGTPSAPPSASPSASPSESPSSMPTGDPTSEPSATPSATPSAAPSESPSATPSATPSASPSESPSASPSGEPSSEPSASPSESPSAAPSASPSESPSESPSDSPSATPSAAPSESPSETPSSSPSAAPSPAPSAAPSPAPSTACILDIELECVPGDPRLGTDCDNIPIFTQICEDRPFEMTFRYNGGDCSQSFNIQPRSQFTCDDFNGGPPLEAGALTYIQAFELGGGEVFFEGLVPVGELFKLEAEGTVSANMNITMWDPQNFTDPIDIVQPENILQTIRYHSSCSRNLFLKDRFGSAQLVEFVSPDQGLVTCFVDTSLAIEILIPILVPGGEPIRLLELTMLTNQFGVFNRTDEVFGLEVEGGDIVEVTPVNITLDLTSRERYTFFTTVVGESLDGTSECNGNDFFEFTAGNPLPPIFPTLAPTVSPTSSPFPTTDPETTACMLDATITCTVTDGPDTTCAELSEPAITQCVGGMLLTDLRFQFSGANCGFFENCEDRNGGPSGRPEVFIEIFDDDGAFFEARAVVNDTIEVNNPSGFDQETITIEVYEFDGDENDFKGDLLQEVVISVECLTPAAGLDAELVLGNAYGSMTLFSFTTEQDGTQSLFADVQLQYAVENPSVFDATINSAILSSFFSGVGQQLVPVPITLEKFDSIILATESQVLDLANQAGALFIFGLDVNGVAENSGMLGCSDFPIFNFTVAALP